VFQSFNLFPHMTVADNVALAPRKVLGNGQGAGRARPTFALLDRLALATRPTSTPTAQSAVSSSASRSPGRWRCNPR
jgi:ABC-type polar amino acid transport system ATPase subunit